MPKPFRVLICRELPAPGEALVSEIAEVEVWREDHPIPRDLLLQKVADKDGVITLLTDKVDEELLSRAPNLKVVSNYAVGFDNVDMNAAKTHRVAVTNTPDVLTETTADLAWALLIAAARRIAESDRFIRDGMFVGWKPKLLMGVDVYGKTLGVVGLGRIGYAVARRAKGFNMRVLYYDAMGPFPDREKELGLEFQDLPVLLKECDFISIHAPLMAETRHMIGEQELRSMKPTAVLVNAARGPLVDERALVRALKEHW
ncbi:MAG: 2-hydroxyacid dehydrogenase, partial [bacterium]